MVTCLNNGGGLFPDGGGIFGQCMLSVPVEHGEEFGSILICSGNPGQERQKRLGDYTSTLHTISKLTGRFSPLSEGRWK